MLSSEPHQSPRLPPSRRALAASDGDTADGERLKVNSGNDYREYLININNYSL